MSKSILTIKIKHNEDLTDFLKSATLVADFALKNKKNKKLLTSKFVKHFNLKSAISNQILRKYSRNKKIKNVNPNNVKLTVPSQSIKINDNNIVITPLKITLINDSRYNIKTINQIELDKTFAYVSFNFDDEELLDVQEYIGVDLNATAHCAVAADPISGKVLKLGRKASHIHKKYKGLRKHLQKKNLKQILKKTKNKESRIIKDLNHKISNKIVWFAKQKQKGIRLEKLTKIRNKINTKTKKWKNSKGKKLLRSSLNSWSFYQLQKFIEYKAKKQGIPIQYINPSYTSQRCSRCKEIGNRDKKKFKCENCNHIDHADVNASFNIALTPHDNLNKTEIIKKRSTDILKKKVLLKPFSEPPML